MNVHTDELVRKVSSVTGTGALLTAFLLFTVTAYGEHYQVDSATSTVGFTLSGSHLVEGTFKVMSGDFSLDPQSGVMQGMVTVDASTGDSNDKSRDKKMTNDEMKAQTFPSVTFAPSKFTGQVKDSGDSSGQVDGTFTLLGKGHPLTVPMVVHVEGNHFTATGSFVVPYVNWGMKDPSWFVMKMAKEVKVDLKLAGTVSK
jgi:polyisoprenoid-binding protein YceI